MAPGETRRRRSESEPPSSDRSRSLYRQGSDRSDRSRSASSEREETDIARNSSQYHRSRETDREDLERGRTLRRRDSNAALLEDDRSIRNSSRGSYADSLLEDDRRSRSGGSTRDTSVDSTYASEEHKSFYMQAINRQLSTDSLHSRETSADKTSIKDRFDGKKKELTDEEKEEKKERLVDAAKAMAMGIGGAIGSLAKTVVGGAGDVAEVQGMQNGAGGGMDNNNIEEMLQRNEQARRDTKRELGKTRDATKTATEQHQENLTAINRERERVIQSVNEQTDRQDHDDIMAEVRSRNAASRQDATSLTDATPPTLTRDRITADYEDASRRAQDLPSVSEL
jgi:hypothetical protein